jgi:ABC-type nitrate/sulfonate/bicarbonate transport system substrate-binding protein
MGFNVLSRAYELFKFPFVGLGVNAKTIQERPDQVKRTLKALIKANRYIRQNREGSIQVLTEWARVEPDLSTVTYDSTWKVFSPDGSVPEDGLRLVVDQEGAAHHAGNFAGRRVSRHPSARCPA